MGLKKLHVVKTEKMEKQAEGEARGVSQIWCALETVKSLVIFLRARGSH